MTYIFYYGPYIHVQKNSEKICGNDSRAEVDLIELEELPIAWELFAIRHAIGYIVFVFSF